MDKFIGKRLDGRYEFLELIGIGGMANVYKARDIMENRDVAIKILKEEYLGNEEFVRRFRNESKAVASLSHPNIVRIYDVNFGDRIQYIVMEYIDGITLKEYIDKAKVLDWKDAVHFTIQILRALQHAHDKGIVHRDVKPQNMMLLQDGTIKVMDFGIACFARDETKSHDKAIGSVHYICPEQASGGVTDAKSDIYSVGVMLYEMLTGKLPFDGDTPEEVAVKQMQVAPRPPKELNPDIPDGLQEIITRAMQKNPNKRYQSAAEMMRDIDEFKKDPSISFEYKYFTEEGATRYFDTTSVNEAAKAGSQKKTALTKNGKKKKNKTIPILIGIAAGVVLVSIIVICVFAFGNGGKDVEDIELPNFVGMKYDDIKTMDNGKYAQLGFKVTEEPNSQYEAGVVFEQYPAAGVKVKSDYNDVKVKVSTGPQMISVPDVTNMSLSDAQAKLKSAGFTNIKTVEQDNQDITAGYVISTDPKSGSQTTADAAITVYYSNGKAEQVDVPNVVGQTEDSGKAALSAAGFSVNVQTQDDPSAAGTILSQNPTGKADKGSTVTIVVSNGKQATHSANISIPLNANPSASGSYHVQVTDSSGRIVQEGNYQIGGTVSFTDSGTGVVTYTVTITNNDTKKSATYGTITVDYSQSNPIISSNLNSSAFYNTMADQSSAGN